MSERELRLSEGSEKSVAVEKEEDLKGFAKLPLEIQRMIFKATLPGPQLVIYDPKACFYIGRDLEYKRSAFFPIASKINSESRKEFERSGYELIRMWHSPSLQGKYINFETDTLLLQKRDWRCITPCVPANSNRAKSIMVIVHYRRQLPFCTGDSMSEEIDWKALLVKFPKLEELVLWICDHLSHDENGNCIHKEEEFLQALPQPEAVVKKSTLDFPWWNSNPEWHSEMFEDIESEDGIYRAIREVTEKQLDLVKKKSPEWPLKKVR